MNAPLFFVDHFPEQAGEGTTLTYFPPNDLKALVKEDRVHRSTYTDPDIFQLEMERIFSRA